MNRSHSFCVVVMAAAMSALVGCSAGYSSPGTGSGSTGAVNGISGDVHGGAQPIAGATVQLWAVGTSGDGSAAVPLLSPAAMTDANGGFSLASAGVPLFSCTNASQVYLTATGGNPGSYSTNSNIALMTALGPCTGITSATKIVVNELTTVAAVEALAQYMTGYNAVGSGTGDAAALAAAFTLASELVNPATGTSPGLNVPSGYTVPTAELNTLADVLATCVNSAGGAAGSMTTCGSLFTATTVGNNVPNDTFTAMLNVAKNPTANPSGLFGIVTSSGPFQPVLTSAPSSFAAPLAPASATLNPSSVSFGSVPVGATSATQTLVLANTSASAVSLGGISVIGANAGDFAETNTCPTSLSSGAVCTISATFSPLAAASRAASLAVLEGGNAATAGLTGTGTASSAGPVTLSANSLAFYQPGVQQVVTLSNYGSLPLAIQAIHVSGNFAEVDTCGNQLSAQSTCNIYVTANTGTGNFSGTLTVVDSDTADAQTVQLTSYLNFAKSYFVGATPIGMSFFGATISGTAQYIPGSNHNGYPVYFYTDTFSGLNPSDFRITSPAGGGCYIEDGASQGPCSVGISTTPSAAGYRYAVANGNDGINYQVIGYGLASTPTYFFDPQLLNFGSQPVGSPSNPLTSTLYNGSTVELVAKMPVYPDPLNPSISTSSLNKGDFTFSYGLCHPGSSPYSFLAASSVPDGISSCAIKVTFTPTATGLRRATFTLTSASGATLTFLMQGYGTPSAPSLPATVGLGNAQPGSTTPTVIVKAVMPGQDGAIAQVSGPGFALVGPVSCSQGVSLCQFGVSFTPSALGAATGTLTVTDSVTGVSSTATLTGTGGVPTATLSTNSLTFVARSVGTQSLGQTITITNNGNAPLVFSNVYLTGTNASSFMQGNNCSMPVAVNGSCSITVTNTPAVTGPLSATLNISTNAAASLQIVTLSGTGQ